MILDKKESGTTGTVGTNPTGTATPIYESILKLLSDNPSGLNASTIIKTLHIPRRTLYNNLNHLKQLNLIQNIYPLWLLGGYGTMPSTVPSKAFSLHNISYILKLLYKPDWWDKRHNKFLKLNQVRTLQINNNPYHQIIKDDFLIQIFNNSMIFISQKHYWGNDPYNCFIQASTDFLEAYHKIEQMFRFNFFKDGIPQVSLRSQHYVKLNDVIADKCKKDKNRFEVMIDGRLRIWVDMSDPFGLEAGHKDYAAEDMSIYAGFVGDIIQNNPPKTSELNLRLSKSEVSINELIELSKLNLSQINGIVSNQQIFDKNMQSHIKAIKDLGKGINRMNKQLDRLIQKKLSDF